MKRVRGKRAGEHLTPRQFANDWISAEDPDGRPVIVRPGAVELDPEDVDLFINKDPRHVGRFWTLYTLGDDRRFRPNKGE